MRLWCVWVTAILVTTAPAPRLVAQTSSTSVSPAPPSSSGATVSPGSSSSSGASPDAQKDSSGKRSTEPGAADRTPLDFPVSLDKIRELLAKPPVEPLKGLNDAANFRVIIEEHQKFEDLIASLKFDSGPPIPGGRAMYEQQQRLFPSVDNPRAQPYAAFTQGELLQVLVTSMMERYFAGRILNSITTAERENAQARARAEAGRAIADYCAAQPGAGAGIKMCDER